MSRFPTTLRLSPPPTPKRETWMHEYCRGVWERWVQAEIEAGTIDEVPGYKWQGDVPGITREKS